MLIEEKSFFLSDHWKGAQGPHFNWMNNAHTKILLFQSPKTFHVIYLCLRHKSCKKNKENTLISKTKLKRISIFIVALLTVSVAVRKWNLAAFKRPFVCNCNRFITFYGTEIVNSEYLCAYFSLCSASILLRNLFVFLFLFHLRWQAAWFQTLDKINMDQRANLQYKFQIFSNEWPSEMAIEVFHLDEMLRMREAEANYFSCNDSLPLQTIAWRMREGGGEWGEFDSLRFGTWMKTSKHGMI